MERELARYEKAYIDLPFEAELEVLRRTFLIDYLLNSNSVSKTLLEVGIGRESIFETLDTTWQGSIVEPNANFLRKAKKSLGQGRCELNNCFLEDFQTDRRYAYVVASSVLHEVDDPREFLSNARNCLAEDGQVIIIVPNADSIHRLIGQKLGYLKSTTSLSETNILMQQRRVFTSESLTQLLREIGLEPIFKTGIIPKILDSQSMRDAAKSGEIDDQFLDQLSNIAYRIPDVCSELFCAATVARNG